MMVEAVAERLAPHVLEIEGINYIGAGSDKIVIGVKSEEYAVRIPRTLAGIPVEVIVTGEVRPLVATVEIVKAQKVRPVVGGLSISPPEEIAGTLGVVGYYGNIISNAHVLAIDWRNGEFYPVGTAIYQPALLDNPLEAEQIGTLTAYSKIVFNDANANNRIDAAIGVCDVEYQKGVVYEIGKASGIVLPEKDLEVEKTGRTTGHSKGKIIAVGGSIKVEGYPQGWAVFKDVILTTAMSEPGDSGSMLIHDDKFVGLIFAGSDKVTVAARAEYLYGFGVALGEEETAISLRQLAVAIPIIAAGGIVSLEGFR
ncbi:MAG TPA: hypothetical protein ENG16_02500 [Archaeoglobus sp.]|nr:hypothetical protein [Archaeoglobus sp.]